MAKGLGHIFILFLKARITPLLEDPSYDLDYSDLGIAQKYSQMG